MKRTIRNGCFETNSSSTHSITMCTESDYEKWKNGEYILDRDENKLVPVSEIEEADEYTYLEYSKYWERFEETFETFEKNFVTDSGETVVAFGYYGYDG